MDKIFKTANNLVSGDVVIGSAGGRTLVENVEPSSAMPGLLAVETEHGTLYVDPELEVEVEA
jgi:hypothetical protein